MKTWVKVVIGLLAVGFVGAAALVGGIYYWVSKNKDTLIAETREAVEAGKTYGASHKKDECIEYSLTKLGDCGGFNLICETKNKMFLQTCLGSSAPQANFCDGIPKMSEIIATAQWTVQQCAKRGRINDQPCTRLMQAVTAHCRAMK